MSDHPVHLSAETQQQLADNIKEWGQNLGFADIGITNCDLSHYEPRYFNWLEQGFHGDMEYMQTHGTKRTRPQELVPGTVSLISARMNYFDGQAENALEQLHQSQQAYISRYALGKDYHKLLRKRLQQLAQKIQQVVPEVKFRAFTDSAPVLEHAIAEKSGLGFIGKNTLIIHPKAGSWFFLGELFLNIPLPVDPPFEKQGCGPCRACIDECPTQAILENNQIDARRCVSYLTIEYDGIIPEELRSKIGNRIYGCDDCQLVCPWNRFAAPTSENGFASQYQLDKVSLFNLWKWNEQRFLKQFEGSPIRRIGFQKWRRNLAIALGNLQTPDFIPQAIALLQESKDNSELVQVHIDWALEQLIQRKTSISESKTKPATGNDPKPFKVKKYYYPADKITHSSSARTAITNQTPSPEPE